MIEIINPLIDNENVMVSKQLRKTKSSTNGNKKGNKPRRAASPQNKTARAKDGTARDTLIKVAKHLFAHQGLSGTSIRDIAKKAGLNSSLISYYFDSKEGLYRACLQEIGESRLAIAQEILKAPESAEELRLRTRMFLENMFGLYLEDLDAGLILVREYDRAHSPAEDVFRQTFLKIFDMTTKFLKKAQENGLIDQNKDVFILSSLLFGTLSSQMRMDHIKERAYNRTIKNRKERQKLLDHVIDLFLK